MTELEEFIEALKFLDATANICTDGTTFINMGKVTKTYLSMQEFLEQWRNRPEPIGYLYG